MKKKVLIFAPFFTPSIKGGGPIISTKNIIENLSEKIEFYVLTSDRDLGDIVPFENIERNVWTSVGNANVMYMNPKTITINRLKKIMTAIPFDFYYLNSFFNFRFSILPILAKKIHNEIKGKIVLAPRGEFSPGALNLKATKKNAYIALYKKMNLQKNVIWHATAESEDNDIQTVFGGKMNIRVANNLTANYKDLKFEKKIEKNVGSVKLIFISRIHPKKNLHAALEFLREVKGNVKLSIFGPIEDQEYWNKCKKIIEELPAEVSVEYEGILTHNQIIPAFAQNHFFLFPTLGENFGHVISEALIGGCPVIISDQTPWRKLEELQVGWDISLDEKDKFIHVIQKAIDMNQESYDGYSKSAFRYGVEQANKEEDIIATYALFS